MLPSTSKRRRTLTQEEIDTIEVWYWLKWSPAKIATVHHKPLLKVYRQLRRAWRSDHPKVQNIKMCHGNAPPPLFGRKSCWQGLRRGIPGINREPANLS